MNNNLRSTLSNLDKLLRQKNLHDTAVLIEVGEYLDEWNELINNAWRSTAIKQRNKSERSPK